MVGRRRRLWRRSSGAHCLLLRPVSWLDGRAASASGGALRVLGAGAGSGCRGGGGAADQPAAPQGVTPRRRTRPTTAAAARRPRRRAAAGRAADAHAAGHALRTAGRRRRLEELVHPRHGRIQSGRDQTQEALPQ